MSDVLPFPPNKRKRPKRITKRQLLESILPFYDTVRISRRKLAHKYYAETYDVELTDKICLSDSLFLAKSSINN